MKNHYVLPKVKLVYFFVFWLAVNSISYGWDLNGPTSVCACGSDKTVCHNTFTVSNYGINDYITWSVYDQSAPSGPLTESGSKSLASGSNFEIQFNNSPGTSQVLVTMYWSGVVISTKSMLVERYLAEQQVVNSGQITFCGGNETLAITQPSITACNYHYNWNYTSPSGYLMTGSNFYLTTSSGNTFNETFNMTSPSSPSNGSAGLFYSTAKWTQGSLSQDRIVTTPIWVGNPSVTNGYVNGSSASGNVIVSSGYANLSVSQQGGTSYNWYVANGSGSLSPSGPNCAISFSNFARVIVEVTNRCGGVSSWTYYLYQSSPYGRYAVYPNPARNQVSVGFDNQELADANLTGLTIFNEKGKAVKDFDVKEAKEKGYFKTNKAVDFKISDLPSGTYFLHVSSGDIVEKSQIIVE
ncbi:T9SS type A sorting domain-containing protein [Spirosoma litoris]